MRQFPCRSKVECALGAFDPKNRPSASEHHKRVDWRYRSGNHWQIEGYGLRNSAGVLQLDSFHFPKSVHEKLISCPLAACQRFLNSARCSHCERSMSGACAVFFVCNDQGMHMHFLKQL